MNVQECIEQLARLSQAAKTAIAAQKLSEDTLVRAMLEKNAVDPVYYFEGNGKVQQIQSLAIDGRDWRVATAKYLQKGNKNAQLEPLKGMLLQAVNAYHPWYSGLTLQNVLFKQSDKDKSVIFVNFKNYALSRICFFGAPLSWELEMKSQSRMHRSCKTERWGGVSLVIKIKNKPLCLTIKQSCQAENCVIKRARVVPTQRRLY